MEYVIQGKKINIDLEDFVFKPSIHGSSALGNSIKINKNEKVLDIGTGTGLLAILSAKLGGIVSATDILPQAIFLAKNNAKKNNVNINIKLGNIFEPFKNKKFDVIIANVPQENLSPKVKKLLGKEILTGINGGNGGGNYCRMF